LGSAGRIPKLEKKNIKEGFLDEKYDKNLGRL
jgi:hypothetical protein